MQPHLSIKADGFKVLIYPDHDSEHPRSWDNAGTLVMFGRNKGVGDKHDWQDLNTLLEWWQSASVIGGVALAVWESSSGSLHAELVESAEAFNIYRGTTYGWIYMTLDRMLQEGFDAGHAEACLHHEIETLSQWKTGDVWGWKVLDEQGVEYGSCWGCYTLDYAEQCGRDAARQYAKVMALDYCI